MDRKVQFSEFVIVAIFYLVVVVKGSCDIFSSGSVDCELIGSFKKYQYGKCVQEWHDGVHKYSCPSFPGLLLYCYLPCMLEKHGKTSGPVYDDCSCVSDKCYRTKGEDCDWYTYCLEQYACSAKVSAVQFAKLFCNISTTENHNFTTAGKKWLRAVQQCIESKINPVLRSKKESYCKTLKDFSHGILLPCFLRSESGWMSYSICNINYTDWAAVLWTSIALIKDTTNSGLKALIDAVGECRDGPQQKVFEFEGKGIESGMRMIKLAAENISQGLVPTSDTTRYDVAADSFAKQLAAQLQWEQTGVQWISFIGSHGNRSDADEISFNILLGSRSMYDVNAEGVFKADMNSTVLDLADAIGNGTLSLDVDDSLTFTKFCACRDISCQETYLDVIPKLRPTTTTVTTTTDKQSPSTLKDIPRSRTGFKHCSGAGCLATYAGDVVTPKLNVAFKRSSSGSKVSAVVQNALYALILKYFAESIFC